MHKLHAYKLESNCIIRVVLSLDDNVSPALIDVLLHVTANMDTYLEGATKTYVNSFSD